MHNMALSWGRGVVCLGIVRGEPRKLYTKQWFICVVKISGLVSFPKLIQVFSGVFSPLTSRQTTSVNRLFLPNFHTPNNNDFSIYKFCN